MVSAEWWGIRVIKRKAVPYQWQICCGEVQKERFLCHIDSSKDKERQMKIFLQCIDEENNSLTCENDFQKVLHPKKDAKYTSQSWVIKYSKIARLSLNFKVNRAVHFKLIIKDAVVHNAHGTWRQDE